MKIVFCVPRKETLNVDLEPFSKCGKLSLCFFAAILAAGRIYPAEFDAAATATNQIGLELFRSDREAGPERLPLALFDSNRAGHDLLRDRMERRAPKCRAFCI